MKYYKWFKERCENFYEYTLPRIIISAFHTVLKNSKLKNIIMIESHNDFDCNGGAFYNYLLDHKINNKYKIVWLLKHKPPKHLPYNVTYCMLYRPSFKRAYYSCKAKYLLADCIMTPKYRSDQVSVYMTHGAINLKSVKGKEVVHPSVDYVLAGSPNYDEIYRNELSIQKNQELLYFGFPCLDILFRNCDSELNKITTKKFDKTILWMPTFRIGGRRKRQDSMTSFPLGIPIVDTKEKLSELNLYLERKNILLILKLHPMQDPDSYKELVDQSNIVVLDGQSVKQLNIDNYRLMKDVNALISDYSSVVYQFLLLNRPIGFVLSDVNDLKSGLAVDNPDFYLTGKRIISFKDFISFIQDVSSDVDQFFADRKRLSEWLYDYRDGRSCERLANFLKIN